MVEGNFIRKTKVYRQHFWEFYNSQTDTVKDKIDWVIGIVRTLPMVPDKFLKHMEGTDGIFEIRVKAGNNIFRIFCCFDEGQLIILFNGFQKKAQKTPASELKRAKELKKQYYADKEAGNLD